MGKSKIQDIFNGEIITVWRDEDWYYFCTPFATININQDYWEDFKKDLEKLGDI